MPPTMATPIAVSLPPSDYPYQFIELIAFRGDFDSAVRPGEVVNPKGIAYHRGLDRLIVSLSPFNTDLGDRNQILNAVGRDGSRSRFAPGYQMFRAVESKIAIVPESGPPVAAGFTPGDVFVGRGPNTEISRISRTGEALTDIWVNFGAGGGLWGGLAFDTEGDFGGRLIAVEANGAIYLVNPNGTYSLHVDLKLRLEGAAIAPSTFGTLARQIIVGVEGYGDDDPHGGEIYAVGVDKVTTLLANIGFAAEDIQFIPSRSGTFFQTQLAFDRERENRLLCVSSSQFLNRLGRMTAVNEMTGEIWEVAWDGSRYTQQNVGRVPGRWSTSGYNVQGTELESGCYAVIEPKFPDWTRWESVPGGFTTDRAPAAATNAAGDVIVLIKGSNDSAVYTNSLDRIDPQDRSGIEPEPDNLGDWEGWQPDPQLMETPHALSCALHNNRMYAFAVKPDGEIIHKFHRPSESESSVQIWESVPGGMRTNTNVSSATVNGRLALCALGQNQMIYLNELAPGGRYWTGWYEIPGGGRTDVTPALASFQDELYVIIKGLTSKRILARARSADGVWGPWAEIPGPGLTDAAVTAISAQNQLYLFVKGLDRQPWVNIASETGTWSGWRPLPNPGATDTSLGTAAVGNRVYLFAKGIDDKQLYVRMTL